MPEGILPLKINRAWKIELKPNATQVQLLLRACGAARFAFNWGLEQCILAYKEGRKRPSGYDLNKQLVVLKHSDPEFFWLNEINKAAPQMGLMQVEAAYTRFFQNVKNKKPGKKGFPRFKSRHRSKSSFKIIQIPKLHHDKLNVPRIGLVKYKQIGYVPLENVKYNTITISNRAGKWFASFQGEVEHDVPVDQSTETIGIDLGLNHFLTTSSGQVVENPRFYRRSQKKLKRAQRILSRRVKGSSNRNKQKLKLARVHYRISCQRHDFLHKTSTSLVRLKPERIVAEDLKVKNMLRNRKLSKSISDAGWGELIRQLEYKCKWMGIEFIQVDPFYPSTKTCSQCGTVKDLTLKDRIYECSSCGLVIDRDLNAARNLMFEGIRVSEASTASSAGIHACGDSISPVKTGDGSSKQEESIVHLDLSWVCI